MANLKLKTPSSGSVTLTSNDTASDLTVTFPAATGTVITTASQVFMRARLTTDQTLTDATVTVANFTGTPSIQIGGTWDTTNKRFTANSTNAGYYLVTFNCQFFNGSNNGYNAIARIAKNGSETISNELTINGSDIRHAPVCVSDIIYLANNDYVDFRVYFDVGSGNPVLSGDSCFNLERLNY